MALRIKSVNADSCFLLTCTPLNARPDDHSFNILLDPWLSGASTILSERFAHTLHTTTPCIESLRDLPPIDLVIVSQDMPDHCHEPTLRQLPHDTEARILAPSAPAKRIRSWKHFNSAHIYTLQRYQQGSPDSVARFAIPHRRACGFDGEVTVSYIAPRHDLKGMHNAIGITFRPRGDHSLETGRHYIDLAMNPPASSTRHIQTTLHPSPLSLPREKTMSILYSPHGVDYNIVKPYASGHLLREAALPLDILLHSRHRVSNAWYFGGLICTGSPGGAAIAQILGARHWFSAHDEEKLVSGISTRTLKIEKFGDDKLARLLGSEGDDPHSPSEERLRLRTAMHSLAAGQAFTVFSR